MSASNDDILEAVTALAALTAKQGGKIDALGDKIDALDRRTTVLEVAIGEVLNRLERATASSTESEVDTHPSRLLE